MAKKEETTRDVWAEIAAPLDPRQIKTREQGGTIIRYIDARDVIHRLNSVVPGEWCFEWEIVNIDANGDWTVKGRLTICGVWHEDVGDAEARSWGGPAKAAVSDALKRCAVHFGYAIELYGEVQQQGEAPQQGKKQQRQPEPPADDTELPPANKKLSAMTGRELYLVQNNLPARLGIHANHFQNRWKDRYGVTSLKDVPDTLEAFFRRMSVESGD